MTLRTIFQVPLKVLKAKFEAQGPHFGMGKNNFIVAFKIENADKK
jgi:hypothetical protein